MVRPVSSHAARRRPEVDPGTRSLHEDGAPPGGTQAARQHPPVRSHCDDQSRTMQPDPRGAGPPGRARQGVRHRHRRLIARKWAYPHESAVPWSTRRHRRHANCDCPASSAYHLAEVHAYGLAEGRCFDAALRSPPVYRIQDFASRRRPGPSPRAALPYCGACPRNATSSCGTSPGRSASEATSTTEGDGMAPLRYSAHGAGPVLAHVASSCPSTHRIPHCAAYSAAGSVNSLVVTTAAIWASWTAKHVPPKR